MTNYTAYIDVLNKQDAYPLLLSGLRLTEQYNMGWSGMAILSTNRSSHLSLGEAALVGISLGLAADKPVSVYVALSGAAPNRSAAERPAPGLGAGNTEENEETPREDEAIEERPEVLEPQPGDVLRSWPAVIAQLTSSPPPNDSSGTLLHVALVDPITYLAGRPIWGAYRACSAAEMIGGAISLAVGGDGKPTLNPIMPGLPPVRIVNNLRSDLDVLPYSIAAGETLGEWLYHVQGLLGIRSEMHANPDDSIDLVLTDKPPAGTPLELSTIVRAAEEDQRAGKAGVAANNYMYVAKMVAGNAGEPRGIVFDDPEFGGYRKFGNDGATGYLINTAGLTVDEAASRVRFSLLNSYSDVLVLQAVTWEPRVQPGKLIKLDQELLGIDLWQARSVEHNIDGAAYTNRAQMSRGSIAWHPAQPPQAPPLYTTGIVDGGHEFIKSERVPRDPMGRIPITMSFLPTPVGVEELLLSRADVNQDHRLSLDDYTQDEIDDYELNPAEWEAKERAFLDGEYNDPYPGRSDNDLTEEELDERLTAESNQDTALKYIAYKRAKRLDVADRDKDGYVSSRDEVISGELSAVLARPNGRAHVEAQLKLHKKERLDAIFTDYMVALASSFHVYGFTTEQIKASFLGGESSIRRLLKLLVETIVTATGGNSYELWRDDKAVALTEAFARLRLGDLSDYDDASAWERYRDGVTTPEAARQDGVWRNGAWVQVDDVPSETLRRNIRNLRIPAELLEEYDSLFLAPTAIGQKPTEPEEGSAWAGPDAIEKRDAKLAQEKWPPRIPLTSIEPMAGALHGLIPGHVQGDICRIAIHSPLFAELVGFQYRSNRQINSHIVSATAGMVAEHNYGDSWSGMVFRPTDIFEEGFDEEVFLQALEEREPIPEYGPPAEEAASQARAEDQAEDPGGND